LSFCHCQGWGRRLAYWGRLLVLLVRALKNNILENRTLHNAGVLSYTTMLSIVPLLAVGFSLIAAFPVFVDVRQDIQSFVFNNFVPASGEVLQQHIEGFIAKASRLTALGIGGLILSALLMLSNIDKAINRIWRVENRRNKVLEFMIYWAVLTLGPLLIGISFAATSYLLSLPFLVEEFDISLFKRMMIQILPFLSQTVAFLLIYMIIPNCRVRFKHALVGAASASVLFEVAKKLFALFVAQSTTYEAIYGALAAIPVFLVWVYLSWAIVLLGGELAYALGTFRFRVHTGMKEGGDRLFFYVLVVLRKFFYAHRTGHFLGRKELLSVNLSLDDSILSSVLKHLETSGLIHRVNHKWCLSRDVTTLTVADLFSMHAYPLPLLSGKDLEQPSEHEKEILTLLKAGRMGVDKVFSCTIASLFEADEKASFEISREVEG
jgi:membrane protein